MFLLVGLKLGQYEFIYQNFSKEFLNRKIMLNVVNIYIYFNVCIIYNILL